ncbi:MAG: hypothetical protein MZV65_13450 [Chromatiales bacterium]|nr:hypothetical protein [Chromatiales bacterium]
MLQVPANRHRLRRSSISAQLKIMQESHRAHGVRAVRAVLHEASRCSSTISGPGCA